MFYIHKNLISLYSNNKISKIYTKSKSSIITKEAINKTFYIYNGKELLEKKINNYYLIGNKIGSLKNINTKEISVFKKKSKKKNKKKK